MRAYTAPVIRNSHTHACSPDSQTSLPGSPQNRWRSRRFWPFFFYRQRALGVGTDPGRGDPFFGQRGLYPPVGNRSTLQFHPAQYQRQGRCRTGTACTGSGGCDDALRFINAGQASFSCRQYLQSGNTSRARSCKLLI